MKKQQKKTDLDPQVKAVIDGCKKSKIIFMDWIPGKTRRQINEERRNKRLNAKHERQARLTVDKCLRKYNIPLTKSRLSTFVILYNLLENNYHNLYFQQQSAVSHAALKVDEKRKAEVVQESYTKNQLFFQPRASHFIHKTTLTLYKRHHMKEDDVELAYAALSDMVIQKHSSTWGKDAEQLVAYRKFIAKQKA